MKALVIEDEPFAQDELKRLLKQTGIAVDVLACIESVEETIGWFDKNPMPDLIFMDIQLADGLSFDIFKQIKIDAPVIFTTAYNEYAIKAFKVNSIDYLLKPIEPIELKQALVKFQNLKSTSIQPVFSDPQAIEALLSQLTSTTNYKTRFVAKVGEQIKMIKAEDVAYFYAEGNKVFIHTFQKQRYIIDYSLDELDVKTNPKDFHRINRSYIVNINSISKVHKYFNSRLKIELNPHCDDEILVSRVKVPDFLNWLEK
jgi:two-component system, LytTR family, response regulator LytT